MYSKRQNGPLDHCMLRNFRRFDFLQFFDAMGKFFDVLIFMQLCEAIEIFVEIQF